jgi:uridine phosphorylase
MSYNNHIACEPNEVGRYVLLPGDPGRCESIAGHLESPVLIAQNREFTTYTGKLCGVKVSVTSTGIGCPSTAIAVEELASAGADTFIRVGTCGGMQPDIPLGSLIVVIAAVRDEGTTAQYIPLAYPAVADLEVTNALVAAAKSNPLYYGAGITQSKDSFYGQQQPERMPNSIELCQRWSAWIKGGVLCSEMESAALFVVAGILRKRAGTILMVAGNQERSEEDLARDEERGYSLEPMIETAIMAVEQLINKDA